MGVGDSLEAAFGLSGPIPAGTWGLSLDGLVAGPSATFMVVRFELLLRPMTGADVVFLRLEHRYPRDPLNRFGAVRLRTSTPAPEVRASQGDRLVLRATGLDGEAGSSFIYNGDGASTGGEIPRLDLPRPG